MDEQNVAYPYNRILFINKKEQIMIHSMTQMYTKNSSQVKKKKPDAKTICYLILFIQKAQKSKHMKTYSISVVAWDWRKQGLNTNGKKGSFGGDRTVQNSIEVMVAQL